MSLWQGTRWSHRPNPSASSIHTPRLSFSGNSSAATSTISLTSSNGGATPPRRPLNALGLRQDTRSSGQPPSRTIETTKTDHDPVKALLGILGETAPAPVRSQ